MIALHFITVAFIPRMQSSEIKPSPLLFSRLCPLPILTLSFSSLSDSLRFFPEAYTYLKYLALFATRAAG